MRAHFGSPVSNEEDKKDKPPITARFEIPYFTVSGIRRARPHLPAAAAAAPRPPPAAPRPTPSPAAPAPPPPRRPPLSRAPPPRRPQVRHLKIIEKSATRRRGCGTSRRTATTTCECRKGGEGPALGVDRGVA